MFYITDLSVRVGNQYLPLTIFLWEVLSFNHYPGCFMPENLQTAKDEREQSYFNHTEMIKNGNSFLISCAYEL